MKDKEKGYEGFGVLANDFHHFANSIYERWDEGLKPKEKDMDGLLNACKAFIKLNKQWEKKKDYATLSSIKKNNPKLYNAYIEREKAND